MKNYRSTVVGFAILLVLLSANAAQSLSGTNTVFSDDITDGQVYNPDIHDRAVTGAKVLNGSLTGADINTLAPKLLRARVAETGTTVTGFDGATNVVRNGAGVYTLTFGSTVKDCAVSLTAGLTGLSASQSVDFDAVGAVALMQTTTVVAQFTKAGVATDTSFSMILACP